MCGARRLQCAAEQPLDLVASFNATVLITELHTNALGAATLGDWREPDDMTHDLKLDRIIQQAQQHEDFITDFEALVGRDEQPSAFDKGHISSIQSGLFLDGKGKDTRLGRAGWTI